MRTTVTLDADVESLLRRLMAERGLSFEQALNDSIRRGAERTATSGRSCTASRPMGEPSVDLDGALRVAADLADEELTRRVGAGSKRTGSAHL